MRKTSSWKLEATYAGTPHGKDHLLLDVNGGVRRDHAWINALHGNWPDGIPVGSRVSFFASPHYRHGECKLTDIREARVIRSAGK